MSGGGIPTDPMTWVLEHMWSEYVLDVADREDVLYEALGIGDDRG